ncbi:MAG: insulinase family protein [Caldiserica bacterium]|jgi:predicted Zn-dependent peptidase|nr:insulinase family protein [Caldisericota bacterium]MDH7563023.1 pitrilysin family protein [Caldisericota bacterium]
MENLKELQNGIRVITKAKRSSASASIALWVGVGSRHEEKEINGISHLIEHLVFQGTKKRPSAKEISEAIEGIGGVLNAFTGHESTCFITKVPYYRLDKAMDVLADLILAPLFREEDFIKEKRVIIEEIKLHNDQPQDKAEMSLFQLLFKDHPLGADIAGTEESVNNISLHTLREHFLRTYCGKNMVVAICGNIDQDEASNLASEYFSSISPGESSQFLPFNNLKQGRFKIEERDTQEAHLCLGGLTISRFHPQKQAMDLLNIALGVGGSSRLYQEIRDRRGLAYYVHSSTEYFRETGCQVIEASCAPEKVNLVLELVWEELEKIKKEGLKKGELERVREYLKGSYVLRLEDTLSQALWLGERVLLEGKLPSAKKELKKYDMVKGEDIQELAQRIFHPGNYSGVIVGPLKEGDIRWSGLLSTA